MATRLTRSRAKDHQLQAEAERNFATANAHSPKGTGSGIAKKLASLIQLNALHDHGTKLFGASTEREVEVEVPGATQVVHHTVYKDREVIREVPVDRVVYRNRDVVREVQVDRNGGLLENAGKAVRTAASAFGKYLTSSSAVAVGLQAAGIALQPVASVVAMPALFLGHANDYISTETAIAVGAGILAGVSDSNNYFEAEDFNARLATIALGSFLALAAHLAKSKEKGS